MITGILQKIDINAFTTKTGKEMFKAELVVNDVLYTTISKFPDMRFNVGDSVFFEVQEKYPTSIELGTLKKGHPTSTAKKPVMAPTDDQWAELKARVAKLEEMILFDDKLPF